MTRPQRSSEGPKEKPLAVFEDVLVPIAPTAFKADGKWHVVYELHVNNMDRWQHQLTKVEAVSGDAAARTLVAYSGAELDAVLARPGHPGATEKTKVEPGADGHHLYLGDVRHAGSGAGDGAAKIDGEGWDLS